MSNDMNNGGRPVVDDNRNMSQQQQPPPPPPQSSAQQDMHMRDNNGGPPTGGGGGPPLGSAALRPVFLGNLSNSYTSSDIIEIFERPICPPNTNFTPIPVDRVDLKRGYSFVFLKDALTQDDKINAERFVSDINGMEVRNVSPALRAEFARGDGRVKRKEDDRRKRILPSETLFVVNFHEQTTKREDLRMLFEPYGELVRIEMKRNYAFVQFRTIEQATQAKEEVNGGKLDQSVLTVEYVAQQRGEGDRRGGGRGGGGDRDRDRDRGRFNDRRRDRRHDDRRRSPPRGGDRYDDRDYDRRRSPPRYRRSSRSRSRSPPRHRSRSPPRRDDHDRFGSMGGPRMGDGNGGGGGGGGGGNGRGMGGGDRMNGGGGGGFGTNDRGGRFDDRDNNRGDRDRGDRGYRP